MGNINSPLAKNTNTHIIYIEFHSSPFYILERKMTEWEPENPPMDKFSEIQMEWNSLIQEIRPHALKINNGLQAVSTIFLTSIVLVAIFPFILMGTVKLSHDIILFRQLVLLGLGMLFAFAGLNINRNNKVLDKFITEAIEQYSSGFQLKGFKISYVTRYTEFCKPKGAKPMRALTLEKVSLQA